MPLMITDWCTKKPVAHIWNFRFSFIHLCAPFIPICASVLLPAKFELSITHTRPANRQKVKPICIPFIYRIQKSNSWWLFFFRDHWYGLEQDGQTDGRRRKKWSFFCINAYAHAHCSKCTTILKSFLDRIEEGKKKK